MSHVQRALPSSSLRACSRALLTVVLAAVGTLAGCPEDTIEVHNLFIEVSSEAASAGKVDHLRVLFQKGGTRFPASPTEASFNPALGALDPSVAPVLLSIPYSGQTFGDGRGVLVNVTGWANGAPVTRFEGSVDLDTALILKVRLVALPSGCDADGDGFFDCSVAGCCAEGSVFGDCSADDASASPWGVEPACKACSDTVDHDCSGGDQPCVDADQDLIADCEEQATCGVGDPRSGPGMPEICDGKDNNCKDGADEGLAMSYGGKTLALGAACGVGLCAGGKVECDGVDGLRCSTDGKRRAAEDCATSDDDDCDGLVNEGCTLTDFDGDGSPAPTDCNDFDAGVFPGRAGESCCPTSARGDAQAEEACDLNCDGQVAFCEAGDADGDGVTVAEGDCNDNDARVAPGKPEKCGDGIDQDCAGGDLACAGLIDGDGDGWAVNVDCDDGDRDVRPDQVEVCNGKDDDCDQMIDEGNPGGGAQCGTSDVGECSFGAERCQNSVGARGELVCVGAVDAAASDVCDGRDEDCDGATDEDFDYLGLAIGAACDGVGACGQGVVECAAGVTNLATCSTNPNGSASGASTEVCDTLDNDCDGELNEGLNDVEDSTCLKLGVCAANRAAIVATCTPAGTWLCDYTGVFGYEAEEELSCDTLDNDCDGSVNEDLAFVEPGGSVRPFGAGCDGDDSDQCQNGVVACHPSDPRRTVCSETGGTREELCDGADNDCDGETDEDFRDTASNRVVLGDALRGDDNGAFLGEACGAGACDGGVVVCATTLTLKCSTDPRTPASPSAPTDVCDGIDNDCDGATDESFSAGGTVKLQGALATVDNGKVKGASCGAGECAGGTVICASPTALACSTDANGLTTNNGVSTPKTDTCNGKDDNCNGTTDDDFVATSGVNRKPLAGAAYGTDNGKIKGASCGIGECLKDPSTGASSPGSVVCNAEGTALICSSDARAKTDVCDNLDNDCNGTDDDSFRIVSGTTLQGAKLASDNGKVKGATCGTGTCANGRVVCTSNKAALVCDSDVKAVAEICDSIDNDCDGTKDNGFKYGTIAIGAACDGIGGCGAGSVVCAVGSTSLATCSTNPNGTAPQASPELCDGVDNDCDESTDEGMAYNQVSLGGGCTGVGACGSGTVVCKSDQSSATCSSMPDAPGQTAATETCDGVDNNCNGSIDEGFSVGAACDGIGECGAGTLLCDTPSTTRCSSDPVGTAHIAAPETLCDGLDNDCDGTNDDGFTFQDDTDAIRNVGQSCDGIGACGLGVVECATTSTTRCSSNPGASASQAVDEQCNGLDDDCDGDIDETFTFTDANAAVRAMGQSCEGIGECGLGTVECASLSAARCSSDPVGTAHIAAPETLCNGLDDDCDGTTDDGFTFTDDASQERNIGQSCEGVGECGQGVVECASVSASRCSTNPGGSVYVLVAETCNSLDEDCDGVTDNGFPFIDANSASRAVGQSCEGIGECGQGVVECASVSASRCSSNPGASASQAQDEVCDALDNDCDTDTDEGLPDIDADLICDEIDECVDVDGDGYGRDGTNYGVSDCLTSDFDCNDLPLNGEDLDGDNVCTTGDQPICSGGTSVECDDNCPETSNALQADANANAVGAACDACDGTFAAEPYEVCGNCLDDDCSVGTADDPASVSCIYRRVLVVAVSDAELPADYSLSLTFDHAFLVAAGRSTPSGADLRLYYRDPDGGAFTQIDRVLDPASSWNNAKTKVWFKTQDPISVGSNRDYYLYSNVTGGSVMADEGNVFYLGDFFDRVGDPDDDVGGIWTQDEAASNGVTILGASANFTTTADATRRGPGISAAVPAATTGRFIARALWNWERKVGGGDDIFAVALQFGTFPAASIRSTNAAENPLPTSDVAMSLAWGRTSFGLTTTSNNVELALTHGASETKTVISSSFEGQGTVDVLLDLDLHKAWVDPDGDGAGAMVGGAGVDFTNAIGISRMRLFAHRADAPNTPEPHPSRKFGYLYLRKTVASGLAEPSVRLGGQEPLGASCTLASAGLIARYTFDDTRDDVASTTRLRDTAPNPLDLFRDEVIGAPTQPVFVTFARLLGLSFLIDAGSGSASVDATGTKLVTGAGDLEGSATATVEIVTTLGTLALGEHFLFDIHDDDAAEGAAHRLSLSVGRNAGDPASLDFKLWLNGDAVALWTQSLGQGWPRTALHLVVDLLASEANRFKLYRDGALLTQGAAPETTAAVALDLTATPVLMVGNGLSDMASPVADIYYVGIYSSAMSAATTKTYALRLLANDDRR